MNWVLCSKGTCILPYLLFKVHHCAPTPISRRIWHANQVAITGFQILERTSESSPVRLGFLPDATALPQH
jgi:hypothetical protein